MNENPKNNYPSDIFEQTNDTKYDMKPSQNIDNTHSSSNHQYINSNEIDKIKMTTSNPLLMIKYFKLYKRRINLP